MDIEREEILAALRRIALSRPNDAIALALDRDQHVPSLDLWGVSEFRAGSSGGIEIKFADRVKAISLLLEYSGGGEDGMEMLLAALQESD